jgi:hypothetical protein
VLLFHSFTVPPLFLALSRTRKAPAFTLSPLAFPHPRRSGIWWLLASRVSFAGLGRSWELGNSGGLVGFRGELRQIFEMNCGPPDQLPPATAPSCFLNLNWDQSMDAAAGGHLDPALSSMVSSPASNSTGALHGISPQPHYGGGTPLSSPPKLNLSMMGQFHHYAAPPQVGGGGGGGGGLPILENLMPMGHLDQFLADPGFAERAARLSGFDARGGGGGGGYGGAGPAQFGLPDAGAAGASKEMELGNTRDESSVSDPAPGGAEIPPKGASDGNARKRKASGKGKGKDSPMSTSAAKVRAEFRSPWPRRTILGPKDFISRAFCRRIPAASVANRRRRAMRPPRRIPARGRPRRATARMAAARSKGRTARRSPPSRPRTTSMSAPGAARRRTATASPRGYTHKILAALASIALLIIIFPVH